MYTYKIETKWGEVQHFEGTTKAEAIGSACSYFGCCLVDLKSITEVNRVKS